MPGPMGISASMLDQPHAAVAAGSALQVYDGSTDCSPKAHRMGVAGRTDIGGARTCRLSKYQCQVANAGVKFEAHLTAT